MKNTLDLPMASVVALFVGLLVYASLVRAANQRSTWFNQDAEVGVKWT